MLAAALHLSEAQFSKLTRASALALLDELPDAVVVDWLTRLGHERGFLVRLLDPVDLDIAVVEKLAELERLLRLRRVRTKPAKADLPDRRIDVRSA